MRPLVLPFHLPQAQTLAFIVIDKVQDRANDLKTQAQSLAETTTKVIDAYNNLAVTT